MDSTFRFFGNFGPKSKNSMLWDSLNVTKCHEMSRKLSQTQNQILRFRARIFLCPTQIISFDGPATTCTVQIVPENFCGRKISIFVKNVTKCHEILYFDNVDVWSPSEHPEAASTPPHRPELNSRRLCRVPAPPQVHWLIRVPLDRSNVTKCHEITL